MGKSWKLKIKRNEDGFVESAEIPEEFTEVSDEELSFLDENNKLSHSSSMRKSWKLIIKRNEDGFVESAQIPEEFTEVSDEELSFLDEKDDLSHVGVMGMHWGVRKGGDSEVRSNRASMYKSRRTMSDDDLAKAVKRLEMEKKFREFTISDVAPGKKMVADQMGRFASTALGAAAGAVGAALVKQALKKYGIGSD